MTQDEQKQAVAEYARAGQRAFGEVEGALASDKALREREFILEANIKDNVALASALGERGSQRSAVLVAVPGLEAQHLGGRGDVGIGAPCSLCLCAFV